jgi:hypothetical protein
MQMGLKVWQIVNPAQPVPSNTIHIALRIHHRASPSEPSMYEGMRQTFQIKLFKIHIRQLLRALPDLC